MKLSLWKNPKTLYTDIFVSGDHFKEFSAWIDHDKGVIRLNTKRGKERNLDGDVEQFTAALDEFLLHRNIPCRYVSIVAWVQNEKKNNTI